ncbi:UNVERIFIED_CONTAM: hypothetical protein PYX00_010083 [Menopon gallinae]
MMEPSSEKLLEEESASESVPSDRPNLNSECLDLLRKKLISDLSLQVFCADLENKIIKMEPMEINKERLTLIQNLVVQISQLSDPEKLLLFLKLPSPTNGRADPLRQPLNPLGNRQEIQQTIVWIKTHLEEDREISIPKQDVYDQYLKYCENISMKPLSTADFGKVMKQVYPGVRPRRLGTRGNSRYCYSGMRNTLKLPAPSLPELVQPNKMLNGVTQNGSASVVHENEKVKKAEKSKRKWKTPSKKCKISPGPRLFKSNLKDGPLKYTKRSKVDDVVKEDLCQSRTAAETNDKLKFEEKSDNSVNVFDACELGSDLGVCFGSVDRVTNSIPEEFTGKVNLDLFNKIDFQNTELDLQTNGIIKVKSDDNNVPECVEQPRMKNISPNVSNKLIFDNSAGKKISYAPNGTENFMVERSDLKLQKVKVRRSNSFSKSLRGFKKSYVPIQPKPVTDPKLKVHFELDRPAILARGAVKKDSSVPFCEDSQEPEEEIVRYFQHLDEHRLVGPGAVREGISVLDNSMQIKDGSRIVKKVDNVGLKGNEAMCQRSQSCFESQSKVAIPVENAVKLGLRSQSSLEFSGQQQPVQEIKGSVNCDREKISHLRLLLEKSVVPEFENNGRNPGFGFEKPDSPDRQTVRCVLTTGNVGNGAANAVGFNIVADRKLPKLVMQRSKSASDKRVPQSPNTSKYFNFTPISPGPRSPLKTPTTPLSSPFVSPRNTPVSRSRQNSVPNEHFLPPSKIPVDNDFPSDKAGKIKLPNPQKSALGENLSEYQRTLVLGRPRSNSSTNFYRVRRNLSKVLSCDSAREPNPGYSGVAGTYFPIPPPGQGVVFCDTLSSEVRDLLGNQSTIQSATSRSQSVPLNCMISEGSWFSQQVSPIYGQYLNSDNPNGSRTSDFPGFEPESKNLEPFIPSEQMTGLSLDQMDEVFTEDNQDINNLVQKIGDELFGDNFENNNNNNSSNNNNNNSNGSFNENSPFVQETVFPDKVDLNANATFPDAFTNESDSGISETIKPYLQSFEGTDDKESKEKLKLYSNAMFENGSDNAKDPLINSFKPSFMDDISRCPNSPILGLFGNKCNEDNPLIEFFGLNG